MLERFFGRRSDPRDAIAALGKYRFGSEILARLQTYLATTPAADLSLIRAEDVALALSLDEPTTLELLATAVHEGLLDLHWDLYCPACKGPTADWSTLEQAQATVACAHCRHQFDVTLDDHVTVRFSVNPRYARTGFRRQPPPLRRPDNSRVSGLDMLNVQAFRDLLTDNLLPAHESLRVSRVPLLFTDLRGSTAIYAAKGDPRAYNLVREHFEVLFEVVRKERGVVVKTIGDSVMATFVEPVAAARAGLAMQQGIAAFNRDSRLGGDDMLLLKLGMHVGPCITVTMNGRMDYFGTAVNLASRVEGLSQGNDLVLTDALLQDSGVASVVTQATTQGARLVSFEAPLRGLREPVPVHRLVLPAPQSVATPAAGRLEAPSPAR
jgi:class 3 adenylate cyclase